MTQNGECHVGNGFDRVYFFDLITVDEIEIVGGYDEGILNFFVVGVFGGEVKYGCNYAENVFIGLEFLLYQCDQLLVCLLVHHKSDEDMVWLWLVLSSGEMMITINLMRIFFRMKLVLFLI